MTRCAIYCRISSDREGAGLGVERQERDCRELAQRLGWEVVEVYADNDISAYGGKRRPDYLRLLDAIRRGELDGLLVWHTDRLHRNVRELLDFLDVVKQRPGFAIQTCRAGAVDLATPTGRALAVTFGAWAQQESEHKADRIRAKARQLAEAGKIGGGGTRPFGFEADRRTIRESEAVLIRDATRRILTAGETVRGLCREWNQRGVRTVTGARWTPHVMRRMLMSARISGRREHHRAITADAEWPAIITPEESDRLRELLSDPARTTNTLGNARRYLLTGFLWCGVPGCEEKLVARPQGDHQRSYVCAVPGRSHLRIHAESLEVYVREGAFDYLSEFVNLLEAIGQRGGGPEATREAELWSALSNYQRRLEEVESAFYVHEKLTQRKFDRLSAELEAEIRRVKEDLSRERTSVAVRSLPTSEAQARKLWDARGLEWRRLFVTTLVERVTVGPAVRGRNTFDPDRVSIKWRKPGT